MVGDQTDLESAELVEFTLDENINAFTVAGGEGNDSVYATGSVTSSQIQGNRGDDTLRLTGDITSAVVAGGLQNETIFLEGNLDSATVYGGSGNDSVTYNKAGNTIGSSRFQDSKGNNRPDEKQVKSE